MTNQCDETVTKIKEQAIIYKTEGKRSLSAYQQEINKAAQNIATNDPSILCNRGKLLEASHHAVYHSGYIYKKRALEVKKI